MKVTKTRNLIVLTAFIGSVWATAVQAVPSFARDTGKTCSYCHNAWPQLGKKGRLYKELGYRLPDAERMTFNDMAEENSIGVSAVLVARPYDKKDSAKDSNTRALHEAEVIIAGAIGKKWSGFFELEAEDESQNDYGFTVGVPAAVVSYNHSNAVNVQFNWGEMFWADPYGLLGDHFRLTRGHVAAIDKSFDGNDGKLRSRRQNLALTGRPMEQLFYSVGISGQADSPAGSDSTDVSEGKSASTIHARAAFDVTDDIMVGGFIVDGEVAALTCTGLAAPDPACTVAGEVIPARPNSTAADGMLEYQRIGLDAQADIGDTRVQLTFVSASDDSTPIAGTENDNDAITLQAYHVFKTATGAPMWVPLIRYDTYEDTNGTESTDELTLNVTYFFEQNIKGYVEFWDRSAHDSADDDDRLTVQLVLGF